MANEKRLVTKSEPVREGYQPIRPAAGPPPPKAKSGIAPSKSAPKGKQK